MARIRNEFVLASLADPSRLPGRRSGKGGQAGRRAASRYKSCQVMNAATFNSPLVREIMDEFICVKFQAENPQDNLSKSVLREFGVIGLPTFVILKPNEAQ